MLAQVPSASTAEPMKLLKASLATTLFVLLLIGFYWVHIRFFKVDVLLYSALADGAAAAVVSAAILHGSRYGAIFSGFEKAQLCVIWLLAAYVFAISIPTVIDRSLSFYILEKLQQRGGGIRLDRFEDVFTQEYVKEHRLIDIRLTEQQQLGTIVNENGCVKLTERGARMARFSRFFRRNFLPSQRLIAGQYSDALVDPFRNSAVALNYSCH
jgi:hypothetical protein